MNKCPLCNGVGFVYDEHNNSYSKCSCEENAQLIKSLMNTGLSKQQLQKSFKEYNPWNKATQEMKDTATNYCLRFEKIKGTENDSLALLGESGSGKTHLISALIKHFVSKNNLDIAYISYIDAITELKQNILNADIYKNKINRYKKAQMLVIDDLFKGGYTDSDIRIMMEIINYRYSYNLPIMVSSEFLINDLIKIDKALGGRIREKTENNCYEIKGIENNYRLHK